MEFKDLPEFDQWLLKEDNLKRILPHERCIIAFQVRRNLKERETTSFRDWVQLKFSGIEELDKLTFLYI
jgi:hypothetical protein